MLVCSTRWAKGPKLRAGLSDEGQRPNQLVNIPDKSSVMGKREKERRRLESNQLSVYAQLYGP